MCIRDRLKKEPWAVVPSVSNAFPQAVDSIAQSQVFETSTQEQVSPGSMKNMAEAFDALRKHGCKPFVVLTWPAAVDVRGVQGPLINKAKEEAGIRSRSGR